ncbi:hypothetical protein EK904_014844 [Melospiza melodia maxima]|nr:hypothetical protein EK904_014844 [Melospiza melodia maxima]
MTSLRWAWGGSCSSLGLWWVVLLPPEGPTQEHDSSPSGHAPPSPVPSGSHGTGTVSGHDLDRRAAILACWDPSHRVPLVSQRPCILACAVASSEEDGTCCTPSHNIRPGSSWVQIQEEAVRDRDLQLARDLDQVVAPVILNQNGNARAAKGNQGLWERFPLFKKLRRTHFYWTYSNTTGFKEAHWKKLLKTLVEEHQIEGLGEDAMDAFSGEGVFNRPEDQAALSVDVLTEIKLAAKTALLKISDSSTPSQSFSAIHQGVNEPFIKFVDHL